MQRKSVVGTRSSLLWLLILIAVILLAGVVMAGLVLLPRLQATRAEQARLAEVERHYQAGVAFQKVEDWSAAEGEYRQVIPLDANYKDVQARLAEVRTQLRAKGATATVAAAAATAQAQADATSTALAAPTATAQVLEARYQRAQGLINLKQWTEAQAELRAVFDTAPNYRDVQAQLATVNAEVAKLTPTATSMPSSTPAPTATPTPFTPTATSTPSSTPAPTATPTPFTPTATSTPSSTPLPTTTPTPLISPTASRTATPTPAPPTAAPSVPPNLTATAVFGAIEALTRMPSRTPTPTPTVTDTPNAALTAAVAYLQALATATAVGVAPEDTRFDGVDGALYVRVPAGEFRMGSSSSDSEAVNDEKPQHVVYLDEFWIMQTETTSAQYQQCVDAGRCRALSCSGAARGDHPVMCVSWQDATDYCAWGGGRLPTEAEWEKAARGTDGRKYPWGNDAPTDRRLNYNMNIRDTTPVGSYPTGASPYGALDMAGNVWEWVADWYEEKYYASSPARNPQGPASGQYRVLRGGSWYNAQQNVHAAYRNRGVPEFRLDALGFRCARSP